MKLGIRGTKLVKIVLPGRVCLDRGPGTPQFSKFATNSLESIFGGVGWPGPQGRVWGGLEGALKAPESGSKSAEFAANSLDFLSLQP